MKKVLLVLVLLLATNIMYSQSASATLNVVLQSIQSIEVKPSQSTVSMLVDTPNKYANGVTKTKNGHLNVVSTGFYDITVKATQDLTFSGNTIPVSNVELTSLQSATEGGDGAVFTGPLSTSSDLLLVQGGSADLDANYDVVYNLLGGAHLLNIPMGSYTTTVVYTLVPQ